MTDDEPMTGDAAEAALEAAEAVFGENVRAIRQRKRMSQGQLAEAAGFARTTITAVESNGRRVDLGIMWGLCRALEVPLSALLDGSGVEWDLGLKAKGGAAVSMTSESRLDVGGRTYRPDVEVRDESGKILAIVETKMREQAEQMERHVQEQLQTYFAALAATAQREVTRVWTDAATGSGPAVPEDEDAGKA